MSQVFGIHTGSKYHSKAEFGLILVNHELLILDVNEPAVINFFKKSKKEIKNKPLLDLLAEKKIDTQNLAEAIQYCEDLIPHEMRLHSPEDQKNFIVTLTCFSSAEKSCYLLTIKEVLSSSYQNLKACMNAIINNLPGAVYWKDREGFYIGCNRHVAHMAGFETVEEMIGKTDYDLCWKEFAPDWQALDQEVMRTGKTISREEKAKLANGDIITELTFKTPLRDEANTIVGVIGTSLDITDKKILEKKLIEAKEKAEKAQKTEDELKKTKYQLEGAKLISGSIAHEIRTPLATIKSWIQGIENMFSKLISVNQFARDKNLAIETITENEAINTKKAIHSISKKVDQSNVIINMLLTKLQNIDFEFSEFTVCSANQCIQNAINEFILPDDMADKLSFNGNNDFKFMGNSTLVMHIIMNLLKNAIFYILKAEKGKITIWLEKHKEYNEIHFKDTGAGISPQVLPHIFDSFFTTESSTGTGVGLAFSKMVMRSHQGKIECFSKEGEYTEFVLSFPKLDKEPTEI